MKTNFFYGCTSAAEVQIRFDKLSKIYDDQAEVLKVIRNEYSVLMNTLDVIKKEKEVKENVSISEVLKTLQEKVNPEGLLIEVCGSWLWISGRTFQVKETLKELGFRYSSNKLCWYWRPEDSRSSNQKPVPFEFIKDKYGSKEVVLS